MDERWHEIKTIWKQNQWLYILVGFIAGLLAAPLLQVWTTDAMGFLQSLVPEAIGITFTVLLVDRLYQRREREREERELKARLIRELGSSNRGTSRHAIEELRMRTWLRVEGLFEKAQLNSADIGDAELSGAILKGAYADEANLQAATLNDADLRRVSFIEANLSQTSLLYANFQAANLYMADLQGSDLRGANLLEADLSLTKLEQVVLDEHTVLPNGKLWTPNTDMRRFTDPTPPDFWRSDDPASPAWRGKGE